MTTTDQYATTGRDPCSRQIGEVKKKPEGTRATTFLIAVMQTYRCCKIISIILLTGPVVVL